MQDQSMPSVQALHAGGHLATQQVRLYAEPVSHAT